ncbi:ROK family transcriptional regulator [Pseudalkalibacillus salsuginis]|uniref:ROK family transcriptional regulator n=1 Tax=Pseudalkalibacillus salsuginis TaxID=2910972 RepID=UPI001F3B4E7D|nr:ROK family transcriptional regulator [Pseudalkalibacillus salsuginis]MCF6410069.1 ROK family transcriptional regulator [Pseudalkalibacillus salsuginis]
MQKGNAAYIKNMNTKIVLDCIIEHEPISRAEISKRVKISKPTVSQLVNQLLLDGYVYEVGMGSSTTTGGRKPVQLCFNARNAYIIGVDIGGSKVASGLTDLKGNVHTYREFPTQDFLNKDLFKRLKKDVQSMLDELELTNRDLLGLGVGIAGVTNVEKGIVVEAPALEWENFPIKEKLEAHFDLPIFVDNDVNITVLGEHWIGAGEDKSNIIYISIGTGIGSGIILNGSLYRGSNYSAGEIGYQVTDRIRARDFNPVVKGFGFLESMAGGISIGEQLSERINKKVTAKEAFELSDKGDEDAREVIDFAIENLGIGISNYISLLDPEIIILGGGISGSYERFKGKIQDIIGKFTPGKCKVIPTSLGKEAGVIGASALFLKEYDSIFKI